MVFDDATAAELLELTQAKGFHLELDLAYAPFPIAHEDRPRFPRLALAVEQTSGFIGGFHLSDYLDTDGAGGLGKVVHKALTQVGRRPETFRVQRARTAAMLTKVAAQLRVRVILDPELEQLNAARASIARFNPP